MPFILDAKGRVLNFLNELCADQQTANKRCSSYHHHHVANISQTNNGTSFNDLPKKTNRRKTFPVCFRPPGNYRLSRDKVASKRNHSLPVQLHTSPQRGVIYTGTVYHFKKIFQSVTALRLANTSLPVEVWVNSFALDPCKQVLEALLINTRCRQFSNGIKGWASKFYSLLYTTLDEVLFIDADNVAARDVNEIFDSKPFKEVGAVLWPDLWGFNCSRGAITVPG